MNKIISLLLSIIFLQLLIFLYVKFVYEQNLPSTPIMHQTNNYSDSKLEALVNASIQEIMQEAKILPKSSEYTVWDKEMVAHIGQQILQQNVPDTFQIVKKESNSTRVPPKIKKVAITKKVEKFAKGKLGKKYVWGAVGPNQFDCSGFTREVFRCTVGITIPRVSRDQAKVGKYIKYEDLKRGDMVFFDTEKKYTGKVNHVGIYLSNGNFIHASSAKKSVIITSFRKKPFYKKRFLWGRRVLKNRS